MRHCECFIIRTKIISNVGCLTEDANGIWKNVLLSKNCQSIAKMTFFASHASYNEVPINFPDLKVHVEEILWKLNLKKIFMI